MDQSLESRPLSFSMGSSDWHDWRLVAIMLVYLILLSLSLAVVSFS